MAEDETKSFGEKVKDGWEGFVEWINPFDPDAGLDISEVPVAGKAFEETCKKNEQCGNVNKVNDNEWIVKGAGMAGGGLLGYKLGENFGTLGKLVGCAIGAWAGCKLSKEVATDVASAADYVEQNSKDGQESKKNLLQATISNFGNVGSQTYTGKTVDTDADITD